MKTIKFLIVIAICIHTNFALGLTRNGKKLWFKEPSYSFGTFHQSQIMKHEFKFKNVSKQRMVIVRASSSCGCTVVDYSTEPLFPGEWGHITVTYKGWGKAPGFFNKGINILTNKEVIRLEINGTMLSK